MAISEKDGGVLSADVHSIEVHRAFDSDGHVGRILIIHLNGGPLWALGPGTAVPPDRAVLQLESSEVWQELVSALAVGKNSVKWAVSDGRIVRIQVSASWEPSRVKFNGSSGGAGVGIGFSIPI